MKGIDRAHNYLSSETNVKWLNVSAKLCTLQYIFVYKTLNKQK